MEDLGIRNMIFNGIEKFEKSEGYKKGSFLGEHQFTLELSDEDLLQKYGLEKVIVVLVDNKNARKVTHNSKFSSESVDYYVTSKFLERPVTEMDYEFYGKTRVHLVKIEEEHKHKKRKLILTKWTFNDYIFDVNVSDVDLCVNFGLKLQEYTLKDIRYYKSVGLDKIDLDIEFEYSSGFRYLKLFKEIYTTYSSEINLYINFTEEGECTERTLYKALKEVLRTCSRLERKPSKLKLGINSGDKEELAYWSESKRVVDIINKLRNYFDCIEMNYEEI